MLEYFPLLHKHLKMKKDYIIVLQYVGHFVHKLKKRISSSSRWIFLKHFSILQFKKQRVVHPWPVLGGLQWRMWTCSRPWLQKQLWGNLLLSSDAFRRGLRRDFSFGKIHCWVFTWKKMFFKLKLNMYDLKQISFTHWDRVILGRWSKSYQRPQNYNTYKHFWKYYSFMVLKKDREQTVFRKEPGSINPLLSPEKMARGRWSVGISSFSPSLLLFAQGNCHGSTPIKKHAYI